LTHAEFENYLLVVAILSGALGAVNLLRPHKRWLGAGSVFVGMAALVYRQSASVFAAAVPTGLAVVCMATDVASRRRP